MEGEQNRGWGWGALTGFGVLTLLVLYVGAYYATVRPVRQVAPGSWYWAVDMAPRYGPNSWEQFHSAAQPIFWPINQLDRKLRPEFWKAPPLPAPHIY